MARFSTNLIVESFLIDGDWKSVEEVSARLASNSTVAGEGSELQKELTRFKLAGRFKLAEELFAEGQYDAAAEKYIELVDEDPRHEFADKALNNAAVAHERTRRFDSALKLYERIFREYPKSTLADAALFRVAINAEQSYDFDKAVENYQRLVRDYPASKDREAALYNAARLLEAQQRYPEAARAFLTYADTFPKSEDAPKNQYRAALIYEKQEDWRGAIRALRGVRAEVLPSAGAGAAGGGRQEAHRRREPEAGPQGRRGRGLRRGGDGVRQAQARPGARSRSPPTPPPTAASCWPRRSWTPSTG